MSFFKKLSRSRTNSNSHIDDDWQQDQSTTHGYKISHPQLQNSTQPSIRPTSLPPPVGISQSDDYSQHNSAPAREQGSMYPRPSETRQAYDTHSSPPQARAVPNSMNPPMRDGGFADGSQRTRDSGFVDSSAPAAKPDLSQAPDLLTRAFNEAVRPHVDRIEQLEAQVQELRAYNQQLEQQRIDIYAWIDKRGLRPDVPPNVAKHMDAHPDAAAALNAQLDRKITIVNFDLHRLQDDLNDTISSSHFGSAMAKFMPEIQRLSLLPGGGRYAFELVVKLAGNLNSHGGIEPNGDNDGEVEEDRNARAQFYDRLDIEMEQVCLRRFADGEDWQVGRDVKRMEKNGAYLKNYGVDPYFPRSLEVMRQEAEFKGANTQQKAPPRGSGF